MIGSASASRATGTCSRTAVESIAAAGAEVGAEEVDRVGDLERRSRAGAFRQHRRRQAGDAELAGRVVGAAARDDEVDLRDRHFVQLDDPDRQAVRELPLLNRRQLQRGAGPGGRRLARDRAPAPTPRAASMACTGHECATTRDGRGA